MSKSSYPAWVWCLGLFYLLVVGDGALRKWFIPSQATPLFVLKDLVLWGGYLTYVWKRDPFELPRPLQSTWVPLLLGAYISVVLLQAANPRQPALIVAAVGLKYHLAFLPLVVLVPALIADISQKTFVRGLWAYALCIHLPIVAIGVYQFSQPPGAWINQYIGSAEQIASVAGNPRVTATFPYIGGFTPYLEFSTFLSISVFLTGFRWNNKGLKILGGGLVAATAVVLPMTGSRSVIFIPAIALGVLLIVMPTRRQWLYLVVAAAFSVFVISSVGGTWAFSGWRALNERVEETEYEEAERRIMNVLKTPIDGLEKAGLFGYGVGTNATPAPRLTTRSDWEGRFPGDRGSLRLILELGILGWLLLVSLKLALLYVSFQAVRASRCSMEFIIAATAFCVLLSNIALPVVFNVVDSALYWGSAGAVLAVWSQQEVRRHKEARQPQARIPTASM